MRRKMIVVRGVANCGKTTTICQAFEALRKLASQVERLDRATVEVTAIPADEMAVRPVSTYANNVRNDFDYANFNRLIAANGAGNSRKRLGAPEFGLTIGRVGTLPPAIRRRQSQI